MDNSESKAAVERPKPITMELSESQRGVLPLLEKYGTDLLSASRVVDLVGVISGIKPVAFIEHVDDDFKYIIDVLGLPYERVDKHYGAVSQSQELLDEFILSREQSYIPIQNSNLNDNAERKIGKLLGYPTSATEYYIKRSNTAPTPPFIMPTPGSEIPNEYYIQFVLSPDNYLQEIVEYAAPLEAATKKYTPEVHKVFERIARERAREGR